MTDGGQGEVMERRSVHIEMGKLIQSVQTLTEEVKSLRTGQESIMEWINQAKGAKRVVAWTASSVGGVIGSAATWVAQHLSK